MHLIVSDGVRCISGEVYVIIECYTAAELGPNCERYCLRHEGFIKLIFGHGEDVPRRRAARRGRCAR